MSSFNKISGNKINNIIFKSLMRYKDIFPAEESGQHFDEHEALCKFDKESQTDVSVAFMISQF